MGMIMAIKEVKAGMRGGMWNYIDKFIPSHKGAAEGLRVGLHC